MDKNMNIAGRGFTLSPEETMVQSDIMGDCVYTESVGDFVLPDYLPEIRKILRVGSRLLPAGKFVGGARAEFAGSVVHSVLYTGADGALAAANLPSDYEFSVPLGEQAQNCEPTVYERSAIDSVVCRLSGPRKLSIRTKIKSCPHILCENSLEERIEDRDSAEDEFALERLMRNESTMRTAHGSVQDIRLSDNIKLEGRESSDVAPIHCERVVHIIESKATTGGVRSRGEVWVKCICVESGQDNSLPFVLMRRIPFEQFIEIEGVTKDYESMTTGRCSTIDIAPASEGNGASLGCDVTIDLEAEAMKNEQIRLTEDMYSTAHGCDCDYREIELSSLIRCTEGNFSVSGSMPRGDGDASRAVAVLDIGGTAQVKNIELSHGRCIVSGECKVNLLLACAPEGEEIERPQDLINSELVFPFKVEFENVETGGEYEWNCPAEVITGRGRLDGSQIYADMEISLCPKVVEKKRIRIVSKAKINKEQPIERDNASILVYYPEQSETLWEIAKRYHTSRKSLTELNDFDAITLGESNLPHSLDGISFVII